MTPLEYQQQAEAIFMSALAQIERLGIEVWLNLPHDDTLVLQNISRWYSFVIPRDRLMPIVTEPSIALTLERHQNYNYFAFRSQVGSKRYASRSLGWPDSTPIEGIQIIAQSFSKMIAQRHSENSHS